MWTKISIILPVGYIVGVQVTQAKVGWSAGTAHFTKVDPSMDHSYFSLSNFHDEYFLNDQIDNPADLIWRGKC